MVEFEWVLAIGTVVLAIATTALAYLTLNLVKQTKALAEQTGLMARYTGEQTRILKSKDFREGIQEMTGGRRRIATYADGESGKEDDLEGEQKDG